MSIIAAKIHADYYEIAADSISVLGHSQRKDMDKAKLLEVNGIIVGGTGTAQETSLLETFLRTHKPSESKDSSVLECFIEFASWKKERTTKYEIENDYLVGFDGKVWLIEGFYVCQVTKFHAIGAGANFATAAMFLGHDVTKAVETAIELSIYCESPVVKFRRNMRDQNSERA
jgi:ATP-dependent protease HslVU (ClpYQ) peptidase subunit